MELSHPRLCADEATKSIYDDTAATDTGSHVAISGLYLSSISNKTAHHTRTEKNPDQDGI